MKNAFFQNEWLLILLLVAATVLVYAGTLRNGFIWDDDDNIYGNPVLTSPGGLKRVWGSFVSTQQYYPLLYTAFFLENKLWKLQPAGYHLTSFLLHAVNAVLLYFLLKRLGLSPALSWLTALFFAVHPVQVESVAWATEMKNVLSGFFYFSAFLSFLKYDDTRKRRYYWLSLFLFVLALLSKTVTATLAPALVLAAWLRRRLNLRLVREIIPFFLLGLAMGLLTAYIEKYLLGVAGADWSLSLSRRIPVAFRAFWFYPAKFFLPYRLCFIYPRWKINPASPAAYIPLLAALAAAVMIWKFRKKIDRYILFGLLYFSVTIAPALGFFNLYVHRYTFVADHFQYLACWGLILAFLLSFDRVITKLFPASPRFVTVRFLSAAAVIFCAFLSFRETKKYSNQATLWNHVIERNPGGWMAYGNLGLFYAGRGEYAQAIQSYRKALEIKPDNADVYYNAGLAFDALQNYEEAMRCYRNSLSLKPRNAKVYNNLGVTLGKSGQLDRAVSCYQQAVALEPGYAGAHFNLAYSYYLQKKYPLAFQHLKIAEDNGFPVPPDFKQKVEKEFRNR